MNNDDLLGIGAIAKGNVIEAYPEIVDVTTMSKDEAFSSDAPVNTTPIEAPTSSDVVIASEIKEEPKEELVIPRSEGIDLDNVLNVPLTRQEIVDNIKAEQEKEEEVSNHSGYFGGPIKASNPSDDVSYGDSSSTLGSEEEINPLEDMSKVALNEFGEEVPSDLAEQYKGFSSHETGIM